MTTEPITTEPEPRTLARANAVGQATGSTLRSLFRTVGSLWFAAVLLVVWLVAMANATVFEMMKGTEWALEAFYKAWWFELILALLALNVLAALALRFPFTWRQVGFVLTHVGIVVTLVGATVTKFWGVDGQVTIVEGETIKNFLVSEPRLAIIKRGERTESSIDLRASVFSGFTVVERPTAPRLNIDDVTIEVLRYLPDSTSESAGLVKIEYEGATYDIPLATGLKRAVPVGDTGYTVRVLRYLPHALVGADNKLTNASDRPINPAIEAEIVGPDVVETRLAFARFPDFGSMHGGKGAEGVKLTFVVPEQGQGSDFVVVPVEPIRERRTPAVLLKLTTPTDTSQTWVQKYRPRAVEVDAARYDLVFADRIVPLEFSVRLNSFHVGYYPGEQRPRSFESRITIIDPAAGAPQDRLISMNHPTDYGGYSFFQSSYREDAGRLMSTLSVSNDPGRPVVFAGYITIMVGMVVVLCIRMAEQRQASRAAGTCRVAASMGSGRDDTV